MRALLFNVLKELMLTAGDILHVALWNQQVAFLEEEEPFDLPAVFIEFAPMEWRIFDKSRTNNKQTMVSDARLTLHLLTPSTWGDEKTLEFADGFTGRFAGIQVHDKEGELHACNFMHAASTTNHDHGELVESLETFSFRAYKFY